jgi:hypothetical protein
MAAQPPADRGGALIDAMRPWDVAGYLASGLVIAAFCAKDIVSLRAVALASNLAFLAYGIGLALPPVWLLHAILLPVNGWRLCQEMSCRRAKSPRPPAMRTLHPSVADYPIIAENWTLKAPAIDARPRDR